MLQIVTMQIAVMDLMSQISEKYKTQAQIDGEPQNIYPETTHYSSYKVQITFFLSWMSSNDTPLIYVFDSNKHQTSRQKRPPRRPERGARRGQTRNRKNWYFSLDSKCKSMLCDTCYKRFLIIFPFSGFTDKYIAETEKEIMDLNAELSALKQTLLQLNGLLKLCNNNEALCIQIQCK